jgi:inositol oxygenase
MSFGREPVVVQLPVSASFDTNLGGSNPSVDSLLFVNSLITANRLDWNYRLFKDEGKPMETYQLNHQKQTVEFVTQEKNSFFTREKPKMSVWEAVELLNTVNDESDPDNDLPQILHSYQTAEKLRELWPGEEYDWLHLTGFIHDLGKVLATPQWNNQPQWAVVGDTFPVGCEHSEKVVYSRHFSLNPDTLDSRYNTKFGMYEANCGFDQLEMSWGHDEYMYQVLKHNDCSLPEKGLYLIRYHSFYPWHRDQAYQHLASQKDFQMLPLLREFSNSDLYSKCEKDLSAPEIEAYYRSLIKKYFHQDKLQW